MKNERIFIDEGSLGKKLSEESEEDEMKTANPSDERKQLKCSAEKEEHSKKRRIKKVLVANRSENNKNSAGYGYKKRCNFFRRG